VGIVTYEIKPSLIQSRTACSSTCQISAASASEISRGPVPRIGNSSLSLIANPRYPAPGPNV